MIRQITSLESDPSLTRKQLAERWNITTRTLKRWEKAGRINPLTLSSRVIRYRLAEVLAIEADAEPKS